MPASFSGQGIQKKLIQNMATVPQSCSSSSSSPASSTSKSCVVVEGVAGGCTLKTSRAMAVTTTMKLARLAAAHKCMAAKKIKVFW